MAISAPAPNPHLHAVSTIITDDREIWCVIRCAKSYQHSTIALWPFAIAIDSDGPTTAQYNTQTKVLAQRRRDAPESRTPHPIKELALALPRSQFVGKLLVQVNGRFIHRRVLPYNHFHPSSTFGFCAWITVWYTFGETLHRVELFERLSNQVLCYYSVGKYIFV